MQWFEVCAYIYIYLYVCIDVNLTSIYIITYGVATISRLLKTIVLFCRI